MGAIAHKLTIVAAMLLSLLALPAVAQDPVRTQNSLTQPGFTVPEVPLQILLFRPEVSISEQTTGGLAMPNADWTVEARGNLEAALAKADADNGNTLNLMPELSAGTAPLMQEYRALFGAIVSAAFKHRLFPGDNLPTKATRFDWTLGPGAAELRKLGRGDFALFVYTSDVYESRGRKAVETISGLLGQPADRETHFGYAGLVDLKTGDLVWINANVQMAGDVRTKEGAAIRAAQLLQGFPKRGNASKVVGE